jgi:hypothetical protein
MEKNYNLDALIICSKHFINKEYLTLKQENEQLKLKNYWLCNNSEQLQKHLKFFNLLKIRCNCDICIYNFRYEDDSDDEFDEFYNEMAIEFMQMEGQVIELDINRENTIITIPECKLIRAFELILVKFDLTFEKTITEVSTMILSNNSNISDLEFSDKDVHFEVSNDWSIIKFGKKLNQATTTNDSELIKYNNFIHYIR